MTSKDNTLANGGCSDRDAAQPNLDDIVTTAALAQRPSRPPDHAAENQALLALADALATAPRTILHKLVAAAVELTKAGSAGISVYEPGTDGGAGVFRWRATAGAFGVFDGSTMPRNFSPCGVVLDRNATQLMVDPVRFWPYIDKLNPSVAEVLLVPFYNGDTPIGTVWIVAHPGDRRFDSEDARLVTSLSRFASAAVHILDNLEALDAANKAKDRFFAVLSHELRTPLTPALITASAMQDNEALPDPVREDAGLIRRNIEVETQLIDDLLDVTRIASGKLELQAGVVNLHDVLVECVRKLQYRVETATTMQGALTVAEQYDFDLLISDLGLPDGSGLDLMRQLLARRKIDGIALATGYGCAEDIARTSAAGFSLHLTKPIGFDQLKNAVHQAAVARLGRCIAPCVAPSLP